MIGDGLNKEIVGILKNELRGEGRELTINHISAKSWSAQIARRVVFSLHAFRKRFILKGMMHGVYVGGLG
jgi:hypothetical protein